MSNYLTVAGTLEIADSNWDGPGKTDKLGGLCLFNGALIGRLIDQASTAWPTAGRLRLHGFMYRSIQAFDLCQDKVECRLDWLKRQFTDPPTRGGFTPQPYEHLAKLYRDEGRVADADRVAVRKRDLELLHSKAWFFSRLPDLLMQILGYGYSRSRALAWTVAWWGLGVVGIWLFLLYGPLEFKRVHPTVINQPMVYVAPGWDRATGQWQGEHAYARTEDGCRGVIVPVYALDLMLPIADLGQAADCRLESSGTWGGVAQLGRTLYQIIGAVLIAVLGISLTGLVRKD